MHLNIFKLLLPLVTKNWKSLLFMFVILLASGGLLKACKAPSFNIPWPWEKSEYQKIKDLNQKTLDEVRVLDKKVDSLHITIKENRKASEKIELDKKVLINRSSKISKDIKDAQSNIHKLDSLANGVF